MMAEATLRTDKTPTKGKKRQSSGATGFTPNSKQPNHNETWSRSEDDALLNFVRENGTERYGTWAKCSRYLKGLGFHRNTKACNNRYSAKFKGKVTEERLSSLIKTKTIETQTEFSFLPNEIVQFDSYLPDTSSTFITCCLNEASSTKDCSVSGTSGILRGLLMAPRKEGVHPLSEDSGLDCTVNDNTPTSRQSRISRQLFSEPLLTSTPHTSPSPSSMSSSVSPFTEPIPVTVTSSDCSKAVSAVPSTEHFGKPLCTSTPRRSLPPTLSTEQVPGCSNSLPTAQLTDQVPGSSTPTPSTQPTDQVPESLTSTPSTQPTDQVPGSSTSTPATQLTDQVPRRSSSTSSTQPKDQVPESSTPTPSTQPTDQVPESLTSTPSTQPTDQVPGSSTSTPATQLTDQVPRRSSSTSSTQPKDQVPESSTSTPATQPTDQVPRSSTSMPAAPMTGQVPTISPTVPAPSSMSASNPLQAAPHIGQASSSGCSTFKSASLTVPFPHHPQAGAPSPTLHTGHSISPEADSTDHDKYTKEKVMKKKKSTRKVKKVRPKVIDLAARLTSKTYPITLKEKAKLKLLTAGDNSPESIAEAIMSIPTLRQAIITNLSEDIGERPKGMRNRKKAPVSVLMQKSFTHMRKAELVIFAEEFREKFPELFSLVLSVMSSKKKPDAVALGKLVPRLAMVYAIMLQARCSHLSRLQRILTMSLGQQICNQKVYDRLNVIGVTLSHQAIGRISKKVPYKDLIRAALAKGKRLRLIGDNLNFVQGVGYEKIDKHQHMVHMFASAAIMTEPVFTEKSEVPEKPLATIDVDDVCVTPEAYGVMRNDLVVIVGRVLAKYLLHLKFVGEYLPSYLFTPQREFRKKTEVISLPVLPLNEQYGADTAKILDYYEELVTDLGLPADHKSQAGGDQLTADRERVTTSLRLGNPEPRGRYAHLGPITFEFFHLGMNFLERMVFDPLWNTTGADEMGTLRGEKERIVRHSVKPDVHKAYEADKQFFINFSNAYIIEAALEFFGMDTRLSAPTQNSPPEVPEKMTDGEKKTWIYETVGTFIDCYAFPYWTGNDREVFTASEVKEEVQHVVVKSASGKTMRISKIKQPSVDLTKQKPDGKKTYGHYVLETGLTYQYFLHLCKTPDRTRLLNLFKLMMLQLRGRSTGAKYPLEILHMMFQQLSELTEKEAHQVLHACFVNTQGKVDSNIPADLKMEWIVKQNKGHIKHMYANKDIDSILLKSSAVPGMHDIAANYDEDAKVIKRYKVHNPKDLDHDETHIMDDLRTVRPFQHQPGRRYNHPKFWNLPVSQAKKIDTKLLREWFNKHKENHILEARAQMQ